MASLGARPSTRVLRVWHPDYLMAIYAKVSADFILAVRHGIAIRILYYMRVRKIGGF